MMAGGFKHHVQRFNKKAAAVTSVLLLIAVAGAFVPTLFYRLYGAFSYECAACVTAGQSMICELCHKVCFNVASRRLRLDGCHFFQHEVLFSDPFYLQRVRPLTFITRFACLFGECWK